MRCMGGSHCHVYLDIIVTCSQAWATQIGIVCRMQTGTQRVTRLELLALMAVFFWSLSNYSVQGLWTDRWDFFYWDEFLDNFAHMDHWVLIYPRIWWSLPIQWMISKKLVAPFILQDHLIRLSWGQSNKQWHKGCYCIVGPPIKWPLVHQDCFHHESCFLSEW